MKKRLLSILALSLALIMLLGVLSACGGDSEKEPEGSSTDSESEIGEGSETKKDPEPSESESQNESQNGSDNTETEVKPPESDTEDNGSESETEKTPGGEIEGPVINRHQELIETSDALANGVQAFFTDATRTHYSLKNLEMTMNYRRSSVGDQLVESIKNTEGHAYIQNTMDVFVRMTDDNVYYASQSPKDAEANLYRFGYYYYQALFEFQNFIPKDFNITGDPIEINLKNQFTKTEGADRGRDGEATSFKINEPIDPKIFYEKNVNYNADEYTVLIIKAKAYGNTDKIQLFLRLEGSTYNNTTTTTFSVRNDGEFYTYYVPLFTIPSYTGTLTGIRLDPVGYVGDGIAIESMTLAHADIAAAPADLSINRHFHVYSDKMHHAVQFAVTKRTENIAEIGMLTEIATDTVDKLLVIDDANKTYDSLDAVTDWKSVIAVAFDVKDAGIFGFILPKDSETAGNIRVSVQDDKYVIEQTRVPTLADGTEGVIIPSIDTEKKDKNGNYIHAEGVTRNGNDLYIAQRVYTDENHDFAEFIKETGFERNPLSEKRVSVSPESDGASFAGYDPVRGIYVFNIATPAGGFYTPYNNPNKDYKVNFTIKSDVDRSFYAMTSGSQGLLECATLMDDNLMLLPIPIEVIKNFSEATGERNLYNISDPTFSEAIFHLPVKAGEKVEYTIINLYQNWGRYPLKQISQIPFHCPYYHLSTGVTETNCILPWLGTAGTVKGDSSLLPDFRSMSAPYWKTQPQHNSSGAHSMLRYTDADGKINRVECYENIITSYGPTYAEVVWNNISDDGKIKVTYTHMEMPQVDENRSYYTMEYEFLDDLTINSFKDNFRFYHVTDNNATGTYKKLGYLNEQNESVVVDSNQDQATVPEYVLGDNCPYFSFFMMPDWNRESTSAEGYANVALLIYNSEFIIGGVEKDYNFLIKNPKDYVTLTLNESGTVEFKKGDKITINAILLPWGSQQYEDDPANRLSDPGAINYTNITYSTPLENGDLYMDKNVRDVRENTLLDPLTVTSETDEIIESAFLPKVRSKDGKTATFTLSGGENNVSVRIYGFNKLTAPKVEELVDGNWVEYVLSSKDTPDKSGRLHYYDGYAVYYDEDGTYSYSFVTELIGDATRTFRISATDDFKGWPREPAEIENENFLKVYYDHEELHALITSALQMFGAPQISSDENDPNLTYVSAYFNTTGSSPEAYVTPYSTSEKDVVTGQYMVIKYRIPKSNKENVGYFEIFATTTAESATISGSTKHTPIADGKWHVDVIDLSKATDFKVPYTPNESGDYCARFVRLDIFNSKLTDPETRVDIAYVGVDSDLMEICELERENFKSINLIEGGNITEIDTNTGKSYVKTYIDPSSEYEKSTLPFATIIDSLNGTVVPGLNNYSVGNQVKTYPNATVSKDLKINIVGWACVEGGVNKYVWSVDGKTWNDFPNRDKLGDATDAMIQNAEAGNKSPFSDAAAAKKNGKFKDDTTPLILDLSAYEGQIVDVTVAAVPEADTTTLVLLYDFTNIDCSYESVFSEDSKYQESRALYGSQIDSVNGTSNIKTANNLAGFGTYNGVTVRDDNTILLKGWAAVDGGVTKYVWTADLGATWYDCGGKTYAPASDANGECAIITVGQKKTGGTFADAEATKKNAGFQGDGITIDLSAYAGETEPLTIYLCAVTELDQSKVAVLYCFVGVVPPAAAQ